MEQNPLSPQQDFLRGYDLWLSGRNTGTLAVNTASTLIFSVLQNVGGWFRADGYRLRYAIGHEINLLTLVDSFTNIRFVNSMQCCGIGTLNTQAATRYTDIVLKKPMMLQSGQSIDVYLQTLAATALAASDISLQIRGQIVNMQGR